MLACVTTTSPADDRFPSTEITVDGDELRVWVADSPDERAQGLMEVSELPPDIDGMLFVFETPVRPNFHMLNTLMDLDVWWFDPEGILTGSTPMTSCPMDPCPAYTPSALTLWALETPQGGFDWPVGVRLTTGETS